MAASIGILKNAVLAFVWRKELNHSLNPEKK
jgi:hypothetical protein